MVADGGIRRGADIVKAIALGATAVLAAWWLLTAWRLHVSSSHVQALLRAV